MMDEEASPFNMPSTTWRKRLRKEGDSFNFRPCCLFYGEEIDEEKEKTLRSIVNIFTKFVQLNSRTAYWISVRSTMMKQAVQLGNDWLVSPILWLRRQGITMNVEKNFMFSEQSLALTLALEKMEDLNPRKFKCLHLANTIAIWHTAAGAGCRFWLDPTLVHSGCCGRASAFWFIFFFPSKTSTFTAVYASRSNYWFVIFSPLQF